MGCRSDVENVLRPLLRNGQELSCWVYDGFLVSDATFHFSDKNQPRGPEIEVYVDGESPYFSVSISTFVKTDDGTRRQSRKVMGVTYANGLGDVLEGVTLTRDAAWVQVLDAARDAWIEAYRPDLLTGNRESRRLRNRLHKT